MTFLIRRQATPTLALNQSEKLFCGELQFYSISLLVNKGTVHLEGVPDVFRAGFLV